MEAAWAALLEVLEEWLGAASEYEAARAAEQAVIDGHEAL